ncbi:MAG: hypothetical protein MIO92_06540, partial [Methanosarcinaceae archaeon]|nr:hypothetical protein [Methanosarcinaceae archaeon]
LDRGVIIGVPISPSGIEILKELYPDEEAKIAVRLPMEQKTLAELKELFPDEAGSLDETLDRMAKRGTVFTMQRPGRERVYSLPKSAIGFVWRGLSGYRDSKNDFPVTVITKTGAQTGTVEPYSCREGHCATIGKHLSLDFLKPIVS